MPRKRPAAAIEPDDGARYRTRSKAKRARAILEGRDTCPISLEPFGDAVFVHGLVKYNAAHLRGYLAAAPGSVDPVTRAPFTDADLLRLEAVCESASEAQTPPPPPLLLGAEAERAKETREQMAHNTFYFGNECRDALTRLAGVWHVVEGDLYHTCMALFRNSLVEIRRDVLSYENGGITWSGILQELRESADKSSPPFRALTDLEATFAHMARSPPPDEVPFESDEDYEDDDEDDEDDDDNDDEEEEVAANPALIPPPPAAAVAAAVAAAGAPAHIPYALLSPALAGGDVRLAEAFYNHIVGMLGPMT